MAESQKQQFGEGTDNFGQAVNQSAKAIKQAGKETVKQAGAKAASNAAAATVKAGVEGGKAISQIAAGTAAGGPWGAILSAAWAMRHTLIKILVCVCLGILFFVVMIVSLPTVVSNSVLGLDGEKPVEGATLELKYEELAEAIAEVIAKGYNSSLNEVENIISKGDYDYKLSMEALINYAQQSADYDTCYILSAYSASMQQQNTTEEDMLEKLEKVSDKMFAVSYEEKEEEKEIPVTYMTYKPIDVTVITKRVQTGTIDGIPQYRYETEKRTYYLPDEVKTSDTAITTSAYNTVTVSVPIYTGNRITSSRTAVYYQSKGSQTLSPKVITMKFVECVIHPFDNTVINEAFDIDPEATYNQFYVTYGKAIDNMSSALKMTLYGVVSEGQMVPLTDEEMIAFVEKQNCSDKRKHVLSTALSLVGKVPYFWGGKSSAGWNEEWNTPKLVTAAGSSSTGTIRPYGLDCSGFTDWTYKTALGVSIEAGSWNQWDNSYKITEEELLPGDLGFLAVPGTVDTNHVLIYAGISESGEHMWVHCESGKGVILSSPTYVTQYRRPTNIDFNAPLSNDAESNTNNSTLKESLYSIEVDVTHYCACSKCCGDNDRYTASGKKVKKGMVAMSSYYPFGTQIMIDDVMYTVEDRGGSGIENDIHRVDIYVTSHEEALKLGRFKTTAEIYRLGW